jgi:plastocyanin domain-containing protein
MRAVWWVGVAVLSSVVMAPLGAPTAAAEARTIELSVTKNGFEPDRVKVTKGVPLKLVVTRRTDETCAKEIVIPDENIKADLPLNKPVTLTFTPKRAGELQYSCGMGMYTGVLVVAARDASARPGNSASP